MHLRGWGKQRLCINRLGVHRLSIHGSYWLRTLYGTTDSYWSRCCYRIIDTCHRPDTFCFYVIVDNRPRTISSANRFNVWRWVRGDFGHSSGVSRNYSSSRHNHLSANRNWWKNILNVFGHWISSRCFIHSVHPLLNLAISASSASTTSTTIRFFVLSLGD